MSWQTTIFQIYQRGGQVVIYASAVGNARAGGVLRLVQSLHGSSFVLGGQLLYYR